MKIAVVAPSCPLDEVAARRTAERATRFGAELHFHPQCFSQAGHFAGPDDERRAALLEVMADEEIDAVWFARGGYGSNRIAHSIMRALPPEAFDKTYMGYSDAGFLLAGLHKAGCRVAHGPMPQDALREGGEAAIDRALGWLAQGAKDALEPGLSDGVPAMAFNLTVLSHLLGTELEPDFTGVDLIVEEVSEYEYRIDRALFHVTGQDSVRKALRMRMGRMSDIPENDRPFGSDVGHIFADWCARSGVVFAGAADVGHDAANRVVPFGARSA
ncbi:LD-carboxypeptidase [Sphingomicrobium nitratireducens]|uniref:LD-carboxypeptidase n=1 Tax=Sphingomicrobium nitratireducens TaxID=2964666 RepID=UPI00223ECC66|nr:LD-carboxypeptidase [Sphingomicrobium nitratireducens]